MLMSTTVTTKNVIGPVKVFRLYARKMMTLARVVKCIYSEQACTCFNAFLPCHVSKSEARKLGEC